MTHRIALVLALVVSPLVAFGAEGADVSAADNAKAHKPNVLFILTDDQGSVDVNCYGAKDLVTPNMDALARDGVRFEQFYAASPLCSPSRAAIMTGKYPQRAGVPSNAGRLMPGSEVTMAEVFGSAGYATGLVGKWHLGAQPDQLPNAQGFDSSFGIVKGCIDNYSHFFYWGGPNRHDLMRDGQEIWREGEFFGDMMVDECEKFLDAHKGEPFFLYWALNMPHYPLQASEKWREYYADLPSPRNKYAAFVSTADELIGRVLEKVDALGLAENTIVVFMSDHGHSYEERTFFGGGSSGPYRGGKFSLFEGGIRVPAIVRWPAGLPKGETRDQMATACDWLPTLAELCGIEMTAEVADDLDGHSIVSVLRSADAPSPHETFHWELGDQWAVREGNWKLLGNPIEAKARTPLGEKDVLFLVDLARDKSEMSNIADKHPEVVQRLRKLHLAWAKPNEAGH